MTGFLHGRTGTGVPLNALFDAARAALAASDGRAVALIYTPRACVFGLLIGNRGMQGPRENPWGANDGFEDAVVAEAYEVRLFQGKWEARWLRHGRTGRVAVLWDDEAREPADTPLADLDRLSAVPTVELRGTINQHYLLWGQPRVTGGMAADGWVAQTSARIGTLWVPLAKPPAGNERAVLRTREYLACLTHGNVAVVEERLCGLGVAGPRDDRGDDA